MSLNQALNIGESALLSRQLQMQTIGNNISNIDTAGYHRQVAELSSNTPTITKQYQVGNGVHVERVARNFDVALEGNLRTAVEQEHYYSEYSRYMQMIEQSVSSNGDSPLANSVSDFADSLQNLANNPEATVNRRAFLSEAEKLANNFNSQYNLLGDLRTRIASSATAGTLPQKIDEINRLASGIADLNTQISSLETGVFRNHQQETIEFRDERDRLVNQLSQLVDISVVEQTDKTYQVSIGGHNMIDATGVVDTVDFTLPGTGPAITWASDASAVTSNYGEVAALRDAYNTISTRMTETSDYATSFANAMNAAHAAGFDLNGTAGVAIFDASTPGQMSVNISDTNLVAASANNSNVGNGDNAHSMWATLDNPVVGLNNDSLRNHADRLVDDIAVDSAEALAQLDSAAATSMMYRDVIASISGVNLDQEMIHMLEVQRSFQGAAKYISTADEMLQSVLNLI